MKNLFDYFVGVSGGGRKLSCSQKGLLALAGKDRVEIWRDWYMTKQKAPFMKYDTLDRRIITDIQFAPYEDYLGIGTESGFQTCMVPGSGEANFDTFEEGINLSRKQKREQEVQKVLEKIPSGTIAMDPSLVGTMDERSKEVINAETRDKKLEKERQMLANKKRKNKMRGKDGAGKEELVKNERRDKLRRDLARYFRWLGSDYVGI